MLIILESESHLNSGKTQFKVRQEFIRWRDTGTSRTYPLQKKKKKKPWFLRLSDKQKENMVLDLFSMKRKC